MRFDGMGNQTKDSYKMLRVDGKFADSNVVSAYKCHADGSLHPSLEALNSYVQGNHAGKVETTDETNKRWGKKA